MWIESSWIALFVFQDRRESTRKKHRIQAAALDAMKSARIVCVLAVKRTRSTRQGQPPHTDEYLAQEQRQKTLH